MKITKMYLFALGAVLALNACKDDDLTAPSISLNGAASVVSPYGSDYSDAGAFASDDKDGDITTRIITSGVPDGATAGKYVVEYNVTDDAGNSAATVTRDVSISFTGDQMGGAYSTVDVCGGVEDLYDITAISSGISDYAINFTNFANVYTDFVNATIDGNTITIAPQIPIAGGTSTVAGSGTISNVGGIKVITMTYTVTISGGGVTTCDMTATIQ